MNPNWTFTNNVQSGIAGNASFVIKVNSDAKSGDQFSVVASGIGTFRGTPVNLKDANQNVIATAVASSTQKITFTFTNYVETHTDVAATYTQSYGYSSDYAPGKVLQPGVEYSPSFAGCDGGASASFVVTTQAPFNTPGLRSSWSGSQNVARTLVTYNGPQAKTANELHTITLGIDRPGTKMDCSVFENQISPYGVGYGIWQGRLMTDSPLSSRTTGTPGPGEYRIVSCSDREVIIEWMPAAVGESFRTQFRTVEDGTTGWEVLGDRPFTFTAVETTSDGVTRSTNQPARPVSDGGGGGVAYTDPVVTKTRGKDGSFLLTVSNPTTDKVVPSKTYTDALYNAARELDPDQLTISEPTMGTVSGNEWTLPALAPGEKATARVEFDEVQRVEPGTSVLNRFGVTGSECVTGAPDPSELGALCAEVVVNRPPAKGQLAWTKVDPGGTLLSGSEWLLTGPNGDETKVFDNALNDTDPRAGYLRVSELPQGDYTLKETRAPDGFQLSEDVLAAEISHDRLVIDLGAVENLPIKTTPPTKSSPSPSPPGSNGGDLAVTGGTDALTWIPVAVGALLLGLTLLGAARLDARKKQSV
ncbi:MULTISPECIES: Ig-like domain-containing protein [unclassified Leucobacter]|uniref:SpaA isopeptide-forming pilin-related protein n=1 Tax=unclassified Leucobacter TaxID=2621730 RepID=UPI00117BBF59|nr:MULTISPECIES: Ig-like domain-containing protein [unclassified Leucobacter]